MSICVLLFEWLRRGFERIGRRIDSGKPAPFEKQKGAAPNCRLEDRLSTIWVSNEREQNSNGRNYCGENRENTSGAFGNCGGSGGGRRARVAHIGNALCGCTGGGGSEGGRYREGGVCGSGR